MGIQTQGMEVNFVTRGPVFPKLRVSSGVLKRNDLSNVVLGITHQLLLLLEMGYPASEFSFRQRGIL